MKSLPVLCVSFGTVLALWVIGCVVIYLGGIMGRFLFILLVLAISFQIVSVEDVYAQSKEVSTTKTPWLGLVAQTQIVKEAEPQRSWIKTYSEIVNGLIKKLRNTKIFSGVVPASKVKSPEGIVTEKVGKKMKPPSEREEILTSWRVVTEDVSQLIGMRGGVEGLRNFVPAPHDTYTTQKIEEFREAFLKQYPKPTKEEMAIIIGQIRPYAVFSDGLEEKSTRVWLNACQLKRVDLQKLSLPEAIKNDATFKKYQERDLYLFQDVSEEVYCVLSSSEEGVKWQSFVHADIDCPETEGAPCEISGTRPQYGCGYALQEMIREKKCPIRMSSIVHEWWVK